MFKRLWFESLLLFRPDGTGYLDKSAEMPAGSLGRGVPPVK